MSSSYGGGQYGGGDYGDDPSGGGDNAASSTSTPAYVSEGTAVPVATAVTADSNTYGATSANMDQHPSTMPNAKMEKVEKFEPVKARPPEAPSAPPPASKPDDADGDKPKGESVEGTTSTAAPAQRNDGWQGTPKVYDAIHGCPRGLEPLHNTKGIWVYQETQYFEAVAQALNIDYNQNNRYQIMDLEGNTLFRAIESTGFCWRCCCGSNRPFDMFILDQENTKILSMHRRWTWCPCAWPGCLEDIRVYHGPHDKHEKSMDGMIGRVTQNLCGGYCKPTVFASTPIGEEQVKLKGPFCIGEFCTSDFVLEDNVNQQIGSITRSVNTDKDFGRAFLTNADNFVVEWPRDLDTKTKATVLGSLFWMDFAFFEDGGAAKFDAYDQSCKLGGNDQDGAPAAEEMER